MEDILKAVGGAIVSLFLVWVFGFVFFPEFGKALGQDVFWFQVGFAIIGLSVVFGTFLVIVRR